MLEDDFSKVYLIVTLTVLQVLLELLEALSARRLPPLIFTAFSNTTAGHRAKLVENTLIDGVL